MILAGSGSNQGTLNEPGCIPRGQVILMTGWRTSTGKGTFLNGVTLSVSTKVFDYSELKSVMSKET